MKKDFFMDRIKKQLVCLVCLVSFIFAASITCDASRRQYTVSGKTMGTFYTVKFISKKKQSIRAWEKRIEMRLRQVNKTMSMYDPESELSRFNLLPPNQRMNTSSDFHHVLVQAGLIHRLTQGAWDGTMKPLIDLWGFGTQKTTPKIPDHSDIDQALKQTGFSKIIFSDKKISKNAPVRLDLGSIAKGFGVDTIHHLLTDEGIEDHLVEIGGELSASGKNLKRKRWSIGISQPDKKLAAQKLYKIVQLSDTAIATSGNYRNFFEIGGKTYSHIIDPRTGFPVDNKIVSATVVHPSCSFADGMATALMVMPPEKSILLVNRLENTECMIITQQADSFSIIESENFHTLYKRP